MKKSRLDDALIKMGFARDRQDAFIVITEGRVFVNGQKAVSPAQAVEEGAGVDVRRAAEYVGRGAYKLAAAIKEFGIEARGKTAADIGAATGGFVDVLLKAGARKVYAIDAGRGKLDSRLREDSRVSVMENTNALGLESLPEPVDLITADVSFTRLEILLPNVRAWMAPGAEAVVLFKPQYELDDKSALRHGIVRDERERERVALRFSEWLRAHGWRERGRMESPIKGSGGNTEYLFHITSASTRPSFKINGR